MHIFLLSLSLFYSLFQHVHIFSMEKNYYLESFNKSKKAGKKFEIRRKNHLFHKHKIKIEFDISKSLDLHNKNTLTHTFCINILKPKKERFARFVGHLFEIIFFFIWIFWIFIVFFPLRWCRFSFRFVRRNKWEIFGPRDHANVRPDIFVSRDWMMVLVPVRGT